MTQPASSTQLAPLARVTEMLYEADLASLQQVALRESSLRASLSALEDRAAEGFFRTLDQAGGSLNFASGQERAWRDWLSVRRSSLQRDLALCMVEKSERMTALSLSLGRRDVAARMLMAAQNEARAARLANQMVALQDLSVLQAGSTKRRKRSHVLPRP
ncbi:hypothetical protein [Pseudooceanicola algae]|uniref:Flagellar FliJ protein n=1 Tax=Pseudooceanicola algae TaxID=1537215 RepID=A0A418SAZ1_9RHOB|nr:hypothetical protein [Pseudooceanicola algae]QPM91284.1 hypothetical protein PSAL_025370 [Pseudooceanicola algae]